MKLGSGIYTVQYSQSQDLRGRSTNSSRGGGGQGRNSWGGGGQGPQKGNSVGIFIPTSKIKKTLGVGVGVKPLDPLDLIHELGSDSKLWGDFY